MPCGGMCYRDSHGSALRMICHPVDSRLRHARSRPKLDREANLSASTAIERLAVYGSLAPGRVNHHHLADISGTWRDGWVEGVLHDRGWGAAQGFPGLRLERGGPRVEVHVLESNDLAQYWDRLDDFEGEAYCRMPVDMQGLETWPLAGWIYALRAASPDRHS